MRSVKVVGRSVKMEMKFAVGGTKKTRNARTIGDEKRPKHTILTLDWDSEYCNGA
jgi:hypothetical protein